MLMERVSDSVGAEHASPQSPWLRMPVVRGAHRIRLLCFAHAGGGASFFSRWGSLLGDDIEVCRVALPGREARRQEPTYTKMADLIDPLFEALKPFMDEPFAMFGHSMGAAVAYEIARKCEANGLSQLRHVVVSGRRAPHLPARRRAFYDLPKEQFLNVLHSLSGTPDSVMADEGLLEVFLPSLRADFELIETYLPLPGGILKTALTAYCGTHDPEVDYSELSAWRHTTCGAFKSRVFSGNHFYLQPLPEELAHALRQLLLSMP